MTIVTSANKAILPGNGVQTVFSFSFNAGWDGTAGNLSAALANLAVLFTDATGNQSTIAQGAGATQCQIALTAPVAPALWGYGGTVTYDPSGTPIATGTTLTVFRSLPLTQLVTLQNQASFGQYASAAERGLDMGEMQLQQVSELFARAIVGNIADATPPAPLPPIAARASQGAAFDALGNLIAGVLPASGVISSAMAPVVSSATLAVALNLLGATVLPTTWSGRQIYGYTPVYDLGSSQFSTNTLFTASGITVPVNKTFHFLGVRGTDGSTVTATIGAGAQFDGLYITLESLSGSHAGSNCYAAVLQVTNDGPGTVKAAHIDGIANVGSTGVTMAVNAACWPVSTTAIGSSCFYAANQADSGAADNITVGYHLISTQRDGSSGGAQFAYGVGAVISAVPIGTAFYSAWMATNCAANARAFQTRQNDGTEIQYIKKTGEIVSTISLTAGTEANGITITPAAITRTIAAGNIVMSAGANAGTQISFKAGGVEQLKLSHGSSTQLSNPASWTANASTATDLGSVGPAGAHTTVQRWLELLDDTGTPRFIPAF